MSKLNSPGVLRKVNMLGHYHRLQMQICLKNRSLWMMVEFGEHLLREVVLSLASSTSSS
jgi:hypothetical protein